MAIPDSYVLPTFADSPDSEYSVDIKGRSLLFRLQWRDRLRGWYLMIRDAETGDVLLAGRRLNPWGEISAPTLDIPGTLVAFGREGVEQAGLGKALTLVWIDD